MVTISCRVGWISLSTSKLGWSTNIRSMESSEFDNIWAGSEISCWKPWIETNESNIIPSIVVESPDNLISTKH